MTSLPRLLLSSPASGHGKTSLTAGLLGALLKRGLRVAAGKCGPDYLDPMFHRRVTGRDSCNLDLFFAAAEVVRGNLARAARGADITVIEGAMGYYDGIGGTDRASAWHVAQVTATPAVLVVRPEGAALSAAAVVRGFAAFREKSGIAGVILNRCSAAQHALLARAIPEETGLPVFGYVPNIAAAELPSRHLGLIAPDDGGDGDGKLAVLAEELAGTVAVDALLRLARSAPELIVTPSSPVPEAGVRIAVARDEAFCFYYREDCDLLRDLGAELVPFSPLRDTALPAAVGGLYLGGGYPELHAAGLAANAALRRDIARAAEAGLPLLAEGGGFLYLQTTLEDDAGQAQPLCGVLSGHGTKGARSPHFGYVTLTTRRDSLLGPAGTELRGHEFHYWHSTNDGDACRVAKASGGEWTAVHASPSLFAGFPHLSLSGSPDAARAFVRACGRFAGRQA